VLSKAASLLPDTVKTEATRYSNLAIKLYICLLG
jgi:hypothetical protein